MRRQIAASQFIVKRLRLFCHYLLESIFVGLQEIVGVLDNAIQSVFVKTNDSSEHVERIGSQAMLENIEHHVFDELLLLRFFMDPCGGLGLQGVISKKRLEILAFVFIHQKMREYSKDVT